MIYRIYPNKDATLYEDLSRKNQNTGKDEILEVGKFYDIDNTTLLGNSRVLVEFDLAEISSSIVSGDITSPEYRLRLENIENREIQSNYELYVYPIKESWSEGIGSEPDTPHNENNVSWGQRTNNLIWDTANSTVGKPLSPDLIASLQAYYDFAASVGNFELVDKIKGVNGNDPILLVSNGRLIMSSSHYSGGTANLSASLDAGEIYYIDFDFNKNSLSGVEFNVILPGGAFLNNTITNFEESLKINKTYNMAFTASVAGIYKLQFSFFDNDDSDGSNGSIDNFYLYKDVDEDVLFHDQFSSNLTSLPTTYILNEGIENINGFTGSAVINNFTLELTSSNFGGATLNRKFTLQENKNYTASFELNPGNYPIIRGDNTPLGIEFTIMSPDGRLIDESDLSGYTQHITSSLSPSISFQARETGEYLFRWTFFASGSIGCSASLDDIELTSNDHDKNSALFNDIFYDASFCINEGGGAWFTSSFLSGEHYYQDFNKYTDNLNVNVTAYVNEWLNNTRTNNGFIIKKSNTDECSTTKFGSIKFFSSDTHTIYPPTLEVRWDDSLFLTGSLDPLTSEDIILYIKGLSAEYKETSKAKIRVFGRDRFPQRSFTSTPIKDVKYLPTTVYYSVVDAETEQILIPFDTNYTKISCDSTSNYFNFWFNGLQPERYYKFIFRVDQNGTTKFIDDNFHFKVVR